LEQNDFIASDSHLRFVSYRFARNIPFYSQTSARRPYKKCAQGLTFLYPANWFTIVCNAVWSLLIQLTTFFITSVSTFYHERKPFFSWAQAFFIVSAKGIIGRWFAQSRAV